jgi:undecaprenyl diphosphate synthase
MNSKGVIIPQHIAIVCDGNRRWAKSHGVSRVDGHKAGVQNIARIVESANDLGVKYITLYVFSSENWNRSVEEVGSLMSLFEIYLTSQSKKLLKKNVKIKFVGRLDKLPAKLLKSALKLEKDSEKNTGTTLILAMSYGAREEIIDATKKIAEEYKKGNCSLGEINEEFFKKFFYAEAPDPDLLIRPGGVIRISNFLLWQIAYAELYFTKKYWPDITEEDLKEAILEFNNRERRYGK